MTSIMNDTSSITALDESIEKCRQELALLRSAGKQRQRANDDEVKALKCNLEEKMDDFHHRLHQDHLSLYTSSIKDSYTLNDDMSGVGQQTTGNEEEFLPPPYVIKQQAMLCRALHQMYVLDNQIEILKRNEVENCMKQEIMALNDEKLMYEVEVLNLIATKADRKDYMEQEYKQILARQNTALLIQRKELTNKKKKNKVNGTHKKKQGISISSHCPLPLTKWSTDYTSNKTFDHVTAFKAIDGPYLDLSLYTVMPRTA